MNSLKNLVIVAVLAAVGYGVYVSINRKPEPAPDPGNAPAWPGTPAPTASIPGPGGPQVELPGPPGLGPMSDGRSARAYSAQPPSDLPQIPISNSGAAGRGLAASPSGNIPLPGHPDAGAEGAYSPVYPAPPMAGLGRGPSNGAGTDADLSREGRPADDVAATFDALMQAVQQKLDQDRLDEALVSLSSLYGNPNLPPEYAQPVIRLLDQLAGTVIYSREHLLFPAYRVRPGDTLEQIAAECQVPWQLLARINGISDPNALQPGQDLKVLRGPFNAVITLSRYELALMLDGRYAGRFAIGIGRDVPELAGSYEVRDKVINPVYVGPDNAHVPADDPRNPLGELLLDLGDGVGLHGTNDSANVGGLAPRGTICLSDRDIDDLFAILSIGSPVLIQR
jgi:hypothetical protein